MTRWTAFKNGNICPKNSYSVESIKMRYPAAKGTGVFDLDS